MPQNAVQRRGCAVLRRGSAANLVLKCRSCRFSGSIRWGDGAVLFINAIGAVSDEAPSQAQSGRVYKVVLRALAKTRPQITHSQRRAQRRLMCARSPENVDRIACPRDRVFGRRKWRLDNRRDRRGLGPSQSCSQGATSARPWVRRPIRWRKTGSKDELPLPTDSSTPHKPTPRSAKKALPKTHAQARRNRRAQTASRAAYSGPANSSRGSGCSPLEPPITRPAAKSSIGSAAGSHGKGRTVRFPNN
jgi:hypothetical protein